MTYFEKLECAKDEVVRVLESKGIEPGYLNFGGAGEALARRPTVPTDARSEFLANRAMGDWAESVLAGAIRAACPEWQVTHYGNTESMAAGEVGFKEFYLSGLDEVRKYGKRPDLLISPRSVNMPENITSQPFETVDAVVKKNAIGALEVRSSKFEALKYIAVRAQDKAAGKSAAREVPSFTVKVEDLKIVFRWIERYCKPQGYVQVFFDSIFMINFLRIFQIIGAGHGFGIETPAKSQLKATIMIPITSGEQIGTFDSLPTYTMVEKVTRLGRHDAYVKPVGGKLRINSDRLKERLLS
jgi:hypothetical protein